MEARRFVRVLYGLSLLLIFSSLLSCGGGSDSPVPAAPTDPGFRIITSDTTAIADNVTYIAASDLPPEF